MTNLKQPVNYLDFNNPVHIVWRKGTPDDPFVDRLDITRIANQRVSLLEIPDEFYRVRIQNMYEVNYDKFIKNSLAKNEFYCDYSNGFIYFHSSKEADTVSIVYKGRGVILYPSSRVVHYDGKDTYTSIHEIIEDSKLQVKELIDRTENFEEVLEGMIIATNLTKEATDQVLQVIDEAEQAIELVNDAYETTVLIYKPYVSTQSDIVKKYPYPLVGWTVQVFDTGIRYRWNGQDWTPIDALGGNIPLATDSYDGLMPSDSFSKLEGISSETDVRTIVFVCPDEVIQGIQPAHIPFPHNGELLEVKAYVSEKSKATPTEIDIQKSTDWENWESVLAQDIVIPPDSHVSDDEILATFEVNKGDIYRLKINSFDSEAYNLTVNIKIKIN